MQLTKAAYKIADYCLFLHSIFFFRRTWNISCQKSFKKETLPFKRFFDGDRDGDIAADDGRDQNPILDASRDFFEILEPAPQPQQQSPKTIRFPRFWVSK